MSEYEIETIEEAPTENLENNSQESEISSKDNEIQEIKKKNQEYNWSETRKKMQALERKNEELMAAIHDIKKQEGSQIDDDIDKLSDDDIITKSHAKKIAAKMAREISNEIMKQKEVSTVEERIKSKYQDFDQVVTQENIEILKQMEPELAMSLAANPDPYAQAVAVYKSMKNMGIVKSEDNMEKKKAIQNSQKPVSANAVSKHSAIGNAHLFENGLTDDLKKQLYKEMQQAMKAH